MSASEIDYKIERKTKTTNKILFYKLSWVRLMILWPKHTRTNPTTSIQIRLYLIYIHALRVWKGREKFNGAKCANVSSVRLCLIVSRIHILLMLKSNEANQSIRRRWSCWCCCCCCRCCIATTLKNAYVFAKSLRNVTIMNFQSASRKKHETTYIDKDAVKVNHERWNTQWETMLHTMRNSHHIRN